MNKQNKSIKTQQKLSSNVVQKKNKMQKTKSIKDIGSDSNKQQKQKEVQDKMNNRLITSISTQRLQQIESQKSLIQAQLKEINQKIYQIKQQQQSNSLLYIRQQISNDYQAKKMAISLVKHHRERKKQFQEKKKRFQQKLRNNLTKQCQQQKIKRQNLQLALREQKRKVISMRIYESKKQKQQRQQIEKQNNSLVKQLIKEDSHLFLKNKQRLPTQNKYQLKIIQRKPFIDFSLIQKHQSQYLLNKNELLKKHQRSVSISYPIKSYQKNRWAQRLEQDQIRQRQEEELKKIQKQNLIQKKIKYGQLIHSLFLQKNKNKTHQTQEKIHKSHSLNKQMNSQIQSRNLIKKYNNLVKTQSIQQPSPQKIKEKQVQMQHQISLRKQTINRLRRIQSLNVKKKDFSPKYQSNYKNYLGKVNIKKKKESQVWNQIMNNKQMSREQKNLSILRKAVTLQNKAKLKQCLKQEKDEVVNLYLDSIQAKLAILKNI